MLWTCYELVLELKALIDWRTKNCDLFDSERPCW